MALRLGSGIGSSHSLQNLALSPQLILLRARLTASSTLASI